MGSDYPDADLHPEATGLAAQTVKVGLVPSTENRMTDFNRLMQLKTL